MEGVHIPRSPTASAHRTVKRPQETYQRMKLTTKKMGKEEQLVEYVTS